MPRLKYNPELDIPDLSGKVILVTGGTSGIGKETIKYLLRHDPSHLLFMGRNKSAAKSLLSRSAIAYPNVKLSFIPCDLSSLDSVRTAVAKLLSLVPRLDLLLCIAGVLASSPALSTDGYEIQFATNHLGHALLIKRLLPLLIKTSKSTESDVRIVITTSKTVISSLLPPKGIQFTQLKTCQSMFLGTWRRHAQSKLANLLYARALAKHYPQIKVLSVHPGIGSTCITRSLSPYDKLFLKATTVGKIQPQHELAWNGIWAATSSREGLRSGAYYEPVGRLVQLKKSDLKRDEALEERLWAWTETELKRWALRQDDFKR